MGRSRKSRQKGVSKPSTISKPCGVFWDIENISIQMGQSAGEFIKLIRDKVLRVKKLTEVEFNCVAGIGKFSSLIEDQIRSLQVKVTHVGSEPNAADRKLIDLIRKFIITYGHGRTIILISGDSDFVKTLIRCKIKYKVTIYVIHLEIHRNDFLDAIADDVYIFNNGQLRPVTKAVDSAVVQIKLTSKVFYSRSARDDLKWLFENRGSIKDSIYFDNYDKGDLCAWIAFPSKELAKKSSHVKSNEHFHGHPLIVHYVMYPPYAVIKNLLDGISSPVREETLDILKFLVPRSFDLNRSTSSITSTLSLPFKDKSSAYITVTGFPPKSKVGDRRRRLMDLTKNTRKSLKGNHECIWFEVYNPYEAKCFADKINGSKYCGNALRATISKQAPQTEKIQKPSQNPRSTNQMIKPERVVATKPTVIKHQPRQDKNSFQQVVVPQPPRHIYNGPSNRTVNIQSIYSIYQELERPSQVTVERPVERHYPNRSTFVAKKMSDPKSKGNCPRRFYVLVFILALITGIFCYFKFWRK